jgi:hypothetical protein
MSWSRSYGPPAKEDLNSWLSEREPGVRHESNRISAGRGGFPELAHPIRTSFPITMNSSQLALERSAHEIRSERLIFAVQKGHDGLRFRRGRRAKSVKPLISL